MDRKGTLFLILFFTTIIFAGQKTDSLWVTRSARIDSMVQIGKVPTASASDTFLVQQGGPTIKRRTASQVFSDIGAGSPYDSAGHAGIADTCKHEKDTIRTAGKADTSLHYDNRYLGLHGKADSSVVSDSSKRQDNRYLLLHSKADSSVISDSSKKYDNRYLGLHGKADSCVKADTAIDAGKLGGYGMAYHDTVGHGAKLGLHGKADSAVISDTSKKTDNRYGSPYDSAGNIPDSLKKKITFGVTKHDSAYFAGGTRICKDGSVTIIPPSSDISLTVNGASSSSTAADKCALYGGLAWTPSANSTGRLYGLNFSPSIVGDKTITGAAGVLGRLVVNAGANAMGDIAPLWGALEITAGSTRTFTNYYGILSSITNAGSALTGVSAYQLYLDDYTQELTAASKYGVFQNASTLPNVFYSPVAIGGLGASATTPWANLHLMDMSAGAGIKNAMWISGGNSNSGDGVAIILNHYYGSTGYYNWQSAQLSAGYSAIPAGGYGTTFTLKTNTGAGTGTLGTVFTANTAAFTVAPAVTLSNLTAGGIVKAAAGTGLLSAAALTAAEMSALFTTPTTNYLQKYNGTNLANSLIYDNGTNVGIGTTNPGAKLDVAGIIRSNSATPIEFTSLGAGTYTKTVIYYNATDGLMIERARTTDDGGGTIIPFQISQRGGGTSPLYINGSGHVGIGTAAPDSLLTVNGSVHFIGHVKIDAPSWFTTVYSENQYIWNSSGYTAASLEIGGSSGGSTPASISFQIPKATFVEGDTSWHIGIVPSSGKRFSIDFIQGTKTTNGLYIDTLGLIHSSSVLNFDGIDTTFACTLFDNTTYRASANARLIKIKNIVTIYFPQLAGTITASTFTRISTPANYSMVYFQAIPAIVLVGGQDRLGLLVFTSTTRLTLLVGDSQYIPAGNNNGLEGTSITYITP